MTTTFYIVDDDKLAIDLLSRFIGITPGMELLGATTEPVHAVNMITRHLVKPDIVFLDVEMPGLRGDEVAPLILPFSEVVYTTAHEQYAVQAFNMNMADYLHKPFEYPRFLQAVNKAKSNIALKGGKPLPASEEGAGSIFLKSEGKLVKIPSRQVIMVESERHKIKVYLATGTYITYITIAEMVEALPADEFMRIHKSYIVNLAKIESVAGNTVNLQGGLMASIGPTYRDTFLRRFKDR